ncbi:MAG TPA: SIMPL domain-containing protein [Candidatus Acidoferrales bacterium]|nr:SIMPL domain-containing protein [Candidatus Acidoferrales bacterium]
MRTFTFCAALLLTIAPLRALADPATVIFRSPQTESTLTVTGDGLISKSPDEARLDAQIITSDNNATASTSKNNDIYQAFKARLSGLALPPDALRTTSYDVEFIPYPPRDLPPEQRQPRYGYVTTRSITVTVSPIDLVGKLIDMATAAGVTSVGNVSFDLKDRRAAYAQALAAAAADGKRDAEALASATGVRLVRVQTISTGYNYIPPEPVPMAQMRMAAAVPNNATPTQIDSTGPVDVSASVTIIYEIR